MRLVFCNGHVLQLATVKNGRINLQNQGNLETVNRQYSNRRWYRAELTDGKVFEVGKESDPGITIRSIAEVAGGKIISIHYDKATYEVDTVNKEISFGGKECDIKDRKLIFYRPTQAFDIDVCVEYLDIGTNIINSEIMIEVHSIKVQSGEVIINCSVMKKRAVTYRERLLLDRSSFASLSRVK